MVIEPAGFDSAEAEGQLAETRAGIFFVVGCGRSGTTLLQVMLDAHSELCLPSETHFYGTLSKRYPNPQLDGRLSAVSTLRSLLRDGHLQALGVSDELAESLLPDRALTWDDLFTAILTAFRLTRGKPRVGEKTPEHVYRLWDLYERYPEARFIHLIRDPRAVVNSYLKSPFYRFCGTNPYHAIHCWRQAAVRHFEALERLDPKRYACVRYESLVSDPEAELQRLCGFLGISFEEGMLGFHTREYSGFREGETHKRGTLQPVYRNSLDQWRNELSSRNHRLVEAAVGDLMGRLGYESDAAPLPMGRLALSWLRAAYIGRTRRIRLYQRLGLYRVRDWGSLATATKENDE